MKVTSECRDGDHDLCDGIILGNQQGCGCPCHKDDDDEVFGHDEEYESS